MTKSTIKVGIDAEGVVPELNKIDAAIRRVHRNLNALKMAAKDSGISLADLIRIKVEEEEEEMVHLPAVLHHLFGFSRSEARRLISQGAVFLNNQPAEETELDVPVKDLGDGARVRVGTRRDITLQGPLDVAAIQKYDRPKEEKRGQ